MPTPFRIDEKKGEPDMEGDTPMPSGFRWMTAGSYSAKGIVFLSGYSG
jgi:hypothetical protein